MSRLPSPRTFPPLLRALIEFARPQGRRVLSTTLLEFAPPHLATYCPPCHSGLPSRFTCWLGVFFPPFLLARDRVVVASDSGEWCFTSFFPWILIGVAAYDLSLGFLGACLWLMFALHPPQVPPPSFYWLRLDFAMSFALIRGLLGLGGFFSSVLVL